MTLRRCCNGLSLHFLLLTAAMGPSPWAAMPGQASAATPMLPSPAAATASEGEKQNERIATLIKDLGSQDYLVRQFAHEELRRLGPAAFDALAVAESDRDIEIASRARYLVQLIRVDWVRDGDSPMVKRILRDYEFSDEEQRAIKLAQLARLPQEIGLEPLCRLIRFEQSAAVAKQGALSVLTQKQSPNADVRAARQRTVESALAGSQRTASRWLLAAAMLERDSTAALAQWQRLIADELTAVGSFPSPQEQEIVQGLLQQHAAMLSRQSLSDQSRQVIKQLIERSSDDAEAVGKLVDWLIEQQAFEMIDEVAHRFEHRVASDPQLLYAMAQARLRQGAAEKAAELAQRASNLLGSEQDKRYYTATKLRRRGLFDWSEHELRQTIAVSSVETVYSIAARSYLAEMLYDIGREYDAAESLRKLSDLMASDNQVKQNVDERANQIRARMHYNYACHFRTKAEQSNMRKHLDEGITHDSTDADILIDLFRDPEADAKRRKQTSERIRQTAEQFRGEIVQSSGEEGDDRATPYNQYAWLIANTEGDFDLALKFSHKSLEIMPDQASYLDTLAHCYAAKRDFKNAVHYQSRAVELEPHTMQIQRSLKRFQAELEKTGEEPQK